MDRWRGVARRLVGRLAGGARGLRLWLLGLLLLAVVASGLLATNMPRLAGWAGALGTAHPTATPTATPTLPPLPTPTADPFAPVALTQYVNPFIGSEWASPSFGYGGSGGQTFPGATLPFGMAQWSPDTGPTPSWALDPGGYTYSDPRIERFSLTHINGAGCNVSGDLPFMPTTTAVDSPPPWSGERYSATFTHGHEHAEPGYYSVLLDTGIHVELTATLRSGLARLRYPAGQRQILLIETGTDLQQVYDAHAELVGTDQVVGWVTGGHFCNVLPSTYTLYFAARFSRPVKASGAWQGGVTPGARQASGPQSGLYLEFPAAPGNEVLVKVGLSYVSVANARANLVAENPGWDFDATRAAAHTTWNTLLNRVQVSGGSTTERRIFYTALYHALLQPNTFSDANGQYRGFDGRVHTANGFTQYANFSGWDIYRTQIPLVALLAPRQADDMMRSLVADAEQGGGLPRWSLANVETGLMVGDPAAAILAEGLAFGDGGFDTGAALRALVRGATQPGIGLPGSEERPGLDAYLRLGYVPLGAASAPTAASLEYYTADYAIACFAARTGDAATARRFAARAAWWSRLFDPATGTIQPRTYDGAFVGDGTTTDGFIEGTASQYTWMVPFDLGGLVARMGGRAQAERRLDAYFTNLKAGPREPQAWMGNEVSFGAPWVYDYVGAPWKTQATVRRIMRELFKDAPDGLPGNDDLGTMSSWYVWAALGLYPLIPGRAGFVLGSPLFPQVTLTLGTRHVRLVAHGAGEKAPYIQRMLLDGVPSSRQWLPLETLAKASEVTYTMASSPNRAWAARRAMRRPRSRRRIGSTRRRSRRPRLAGHPDPARREGVD
ncbi:MAG TPA: GH92 family glycosyl hydrolase [Ktedonobacterales bacterium]